MKLKLCVILTAVIAVAVFAAGCATKKHVREAITPVQNQVNVVQKQTEENRQAIGDLDRQVAVADEKATEARKHADAAAAAAQTTQQHADSATSLAQQAQQGVASLGERVEEVQGQFQNLDNYKLMTSETVHFKIDATSLSNEDKAHLDRIVQTAAGQRNYLIEVEGFADRTGTQAYNMELSRRRAEAVVHYLVIQHDVPLRSIRVIGGGSDFPNAVNRTAADRRENRRVDIKIYGLNVSEAVAKK